MQDRLLSQTVHFESFEPPSFIHMDRLVEPLETFTLTQDRQLWTGPVEKQTQKSCQSILIGRETIKHQTRLDMGPRLEK